MSLLGIIKEGQIISADTIDIYEKEYRNLTTSQREEVWEELNKYFKSQGISNRDLFYSYWRWYVALSWDYFMTRDKVFLSDMAFSRQIPMAILLDYDVWDSLISYLQIKTLDRQDMEALYSRIRDNFINSEAVLGKNEEKDYTIANLVQEIRVLNARGNDSIAEAEFRNKIIRIMFPKEDELFDKYIFVDQDSAVDRLFYLTQFFLGMEPENIWYFEETYWHPEKYEKAPEGEKTPAAAPMPAASVPAVPVKPETTQPPKQTSSEPAQALAKPPETKKSQPMDLAKIRQTIDSQFKKDSSGQYEDITGVLEKMGELAAKNNDPKISEMLYFDEQAGAFKWII
jgi:hypothetical protein